MTSPCLQVDVFAVYAITLVGGRHVLLPSFNAQDTLLAIGEGTHTERSREDPDHRVRPEGGVRPQTGPRFVSGADSFSAQDTLLSIGEGRTERSRGAFQGAGDVPGERVFGRASLGLMLVWA
jgi:hypothetical protein